MADKHADGTTERSQIIDTLNKLHPGNLVDVQFNAGVKPRIKCKLIGYEDTRYILVSVPATARNGSYEDQLQLGNGCIIRAIVEGDAGQCIAFKTVIDGLIKKPHHLLFFEYPKQIQMFSLRNQTRVTTHVPATLTDKIVISQGKGDEDENRYNGTIIDLSVGGCRFKLPWPLGHGRVNLRDVMVRINFPSRPNDPVNLAGEVKSQNRHNSKFITLGISFGEVPELVELFSQLGIEDDELSLNGS